MPSCAFLKCKNNTRNKHKNEGITFHTFPRNFEVRNSWVETIRISRRDEEWEANQFSRVCSIHFDESDMYLTSKGFRKIKKAAVPISQKSQKPDHIFLAPNSPTSTIVSIPSSINRAKDTEYLKKINRLSHENKVCKSKIKLLRQKHSLLLKKYMMLELSVHNLKIKMRPDKPDCLPAETKLMNTEASLSTSIENYKGTKQTFSNRRGVLKKRKYPPSLKKFASTLHLYSPAAYKYVRRVFALALLHPRILKYWLDRVRQKPDLLTKLFRV